MIGMIGLDYRVASADVRGRISFAGERLNEALITLVDDPAINEAVIVSTCNRTEIYFAAADCLSATEHVRCFLGATFAQAGGTPAVTQTLASTVALDRPMLQQWLPPGHDQPANPPEELTRALYTVAGLEVARHLFHVAAGLQSQVLGETQILGQVKTALAAAESLRTVGNELRALFTSAIRVGKRVRNATGIGQADRSVAALAVQGAEAVLGGLAGAAVLIIGAGGTSQQCARLLRAAGAGQIFLANRSPDAAAKLADAVGGAPVALDDVAEVISSVALIISATAAPHSVLHSATVARGLKGRDAPLLILDLAVPYDVDPAVGRLPGVSLYNVDTLCALEQTDAWERTTQRATELARAEEIVAAGVDEFARERTIRLAGPSIAALRQQIDHDGQEERARALARLQHLSPADRAVIERFGQRLVDKLFHRLVTRMCALTNDDVLPPDDMVQVLTRLFAD
jgi:glutamyl-tRNA reductase